MATQGLLPHTPHSTENLYTERFEGGEGQPTVGRCGRRNDQDMWRNLSSGGRNEAATRVAGREEAHQGVGKGFLFDTHSVLPKLWLASKRVVRSGGVQ